MEPVQTSYLIMAFLARDCNNSPLVIGLTMSYYFMRAAVPDIPSNVLQGFLLYSINSRATAEEQLLVLYHMLDPVVLINPLTISTSQASKIGLEAFDPRGLNYFETLDTLAFGAVNTEGRHILNPDDRGKFVEYCRENKGNLDPDEFWRLIRPQNFDRRREVAELFNWNRNSEPATLSSLKFLQKIIQS